jgi:hypothetical protein
MRKSQDDSSHHTVRIPSQSVGPGSDVPLEADGTRQIHSRYGKRSKEEGERTPVCGWRKQPGGGLGYYRSVKREFRVLPVRFRSENQVG